MRPTVIAVAIMLAVCLGVFGSSWVIPRTAYKGVQCDPPTEGYLLSGTNETGLLNPGYYSLVLKGNLDGADVKAQYGDGAGWRDMGLRDWPGLAAVIAFGLDSHFRIKVEWATAKTAVCAYLKPMDSSAKGYMDL